MSSFSLSTCSYDDDDYYDVGNDGVGAGDDDADDDGDGHWRRNHTSSSSALSF